MHLWDVEQMRGVPVRTNRLYALITIVAVATGAGCIPRGRTASPGPSSLNAITTARITNNNWLDVRVYGVQGGSRNVIGTVRSFGTEVFELPSQFVATRGLRIFVDPIGSRQSYQTDLIPIWPGQMIDLVVQNRIQLSHYSVRGP
jgi:hypothetical protein